MTSSDSIGNFFFLIESDEVLPFHHFNTHTHIYIYIHIVIYRQTVSLYHNASVWLDTLDVSRWGRNLPKFTLNWYPTTKPFRRPKSAREFNTLCFCLFTFYAIGYRSAYFVRRALHYVSGSC